MVYLTFYAVQNEKGQFLRKDFYFVDSLDQAKVYSKIGPARQRVTVYKKAFPDKPCLKICELKVLEMVVLDDEARASKAIRKQNEKELIAEAMETQRRLEKQIRKFVELSEKLNGKLSPEGKIELVNLWTRNV